MAYELRHYAVKSKFNKPLSLCADSIYNRKCISDGCINLYEGKIARCPTSGRVVIGADSGGTRELIGEHEERGYLYTWNRPKELADRIEYVLGHPVEAEEKEREAQEFILGLTDLERYTEKLARVYQKVADHTHRK